MLHPRPAHLGGGAGDCPFLVAGLGTRPLGMAWLPAVVQETRLPRGGGASREVYKDGTIVAKGGRERPANSPTYRLELSS